MLEPKQPKEDSNRPARKRRLALKLLLTGLGMILMIWLGIWAVLHRETGVLIVTSRPTGAEVILNRKPTNLLTNAFLCDLPADSFIISLRMDGHRPVPPTQRIGVQPNETTRVTFLMAPIRRGDVRELPPVSGMPHNWQWRIIKINSEPPGAAIMVDDKELGVTAPLTVLFEPGEHYLQARWPDGTKGFKTVDIEAGSTQPDIIMKPVTYKPMTPRTTKKKQP